MCGDHALIRPYKEPVVTDKTNTGDAESLVKSEDPMHPANVICELCRLFYTLGWVTGTGGGISVREGDLIYLAPSGVQKERLHAHQMFILHYQTLEYIRTPPAPLKASACTPLFLQAYLRRTAGACIHTHSMHAVMATLLKGGNEKVWRIRAAEMIKAIPRGGLGVGENGYVSPSIDKGKYLGCFEELAIPIIENRSREEDLREELARAMKEFPETCAVLVRRHGVYVWGETVWKAKTQCESLDYLFQLSVEMSKMGLDPNAPIEEVETD